MLSLSLALDFIDGPLARRLGMCTQFGDLLDHVADHITMWWLVYITTSSTLNSLVNGLHCAVALLYMAKEGHYFKHSQGGNAVTKLIESNNYFNMPSLLWNANTWVIPLMKLSYALEHVVCCAECCGRGIVACGGVAWWCVWCDVWCVVRMVVIPCPDTPLPCDSGLPRNASTELLDVLDFLGCTVSISYTVAVLWPTRTRGGKAAASESINRGEVDAHAD
ncbi:MAG: hypothetical protein SGPRY_007496 [Prymnesium sp.]